MVGFLARFVALSGLLASALGRATHRLFDPHDLVPHAELQSRDASSVNHHRNGPSASILGLVLAANVTTDTVRDAFYDAKIVPDVVPSFDPTFLLEVNFTNPGLENSSVIVEPGALLTRNQTKFLPEFYISNYTEDDASKTYIVVQVDPDAHTPQDPDVAQVRHLLAGNYTTDGDSAGDPLPLFNSSVAVSDWVRPSPPAGSDPHRYVLLLYPQPENFTVNSIAPLVNTSSPITLFNISEFVEATGLGLPVAGTYFLTGPDEDST